ncbi:hypothetical protein KCV87_32165 [Actinosynnema pretiosum subsp. pretiosum]|uniref:Uncharacterized protein n=1 Tax=Actinosynnema pretiosum subsp. pretiosum TaxID=103721 RepID=A0AA45L5N2_9PSEU|nr:hypothetical protein APASM_4706 [Actinosynnema pretiosum subsp. pretiosum]QUF03959.1 hypothetical protein KCV87_32165 [Actinosynnema pretiosum subsp. pretiosum]
MRGLPPDSALARQEGAWSLLEENTAQLVDVVSHLAETAWADRVTDPDDPDVRAARQQARAAGRRPPRHAPVVPVALRPAAVGEQLLRAYTERLAGFGATAPQDPGHDDDDGGFNALAAMFTGRLRPQ